MAFTKKKQNDSSDDTNKYDSWATPQYLFDELDEQFHFTVDVCATKNNANCKKYYSRKQNGLKQTWEEQVCWCNPPYGHGEIDKWMKKSYESSLTGATVVCLVPSSTCTRWWHDYCMKGEIWFIKGRVKFNIGGREDKPAPFASAIVIFMAPKGKSAK